MLKNIPLKTMSKLAIAVISSLAVNAYSTPIKQDLDLLSNDIQEVVLIDRSIEDYQDLLFDIKLTAGNRKVEIVELNPKNGKLDTLEDISLALGKYKQLDAIHLFSHGYSGALKLGDQIVDKKDIKQNADSFVAWNKSLKEDGKILLYGCNVSKGQRGQKFIEELAQITEADVYASNDYSGIPKQNQDWILESATGIASYNPIISNHRDNRFTANLQIEGTDAFLEGDNVIVGIGSDGAFGTSATKPNAPLLGANIGLVSDPKRQKFTNGYDGDFFLPGRTEEGWAVKLNGTAYNNNRVAQGAQIPGSLSNFRDEARRQLVDWSGEIDGLRVEKTYRINKKGISLIIDIKLTNSTGSTMTDVYYMRTVDPDNNQRKTGNYVTTNTIVQQGDTGLAEVEATQGDGSKIKMTARSTDARAAVGAEASTGGLSVRDPANVYNGTDGLKVSGSVTADTSISMVYKFDKIEPFESTEIFSIGYDLADLVPPVVKLDDNNSTGLTDGNYKKVYGIGTSPIGISDTDVTISSDNATGYETLTVKLLNPFPGDKITLEGALPNGLNVDATGQNDDNGISLEGFSDGGVYIDAIKQLRFENSQLDTSLETREIELMVSDDALTPSKTVKAYIYMTVPLIINQPVSGDNQLSDAEVPGGLDLAGTTAPDSTLVLTLTDPEGTTTTETVQIPGSSPDWSLTVPEEEIKKLKDGVITVTGKSTDPNGNILEEQMTFVKDTTVNVEITSPKENEEIDSDTMLIEGTSDPDAAVVVTTLDGKTCSSSVNSQGKWSCTIDDLEKGITYPILATATDPLANKATDKENLSRIDLALKITSPTHLGFADGETPLIKGTTKPGVDITVTVEDGEECKTTSNANGDWSCHMGERPIGELQNVSVYAKDPRNEGEDTKPLIYTIPDRPLIASNPGVGQVVVTKLPVEIEGTFNPNTPITISNEDGEQCITQTDKRGKWECEFNKMKTGNHDLTITALNSDGSENEIIRNFDLKIIEGRVETIINGGGNIGGFIFAFLMLLLVRAKLRTNNLLKVTK